MAIIAGTPKRIEPLKIGDHVRFYKPRRDVGPDGIGWVLNITEHQIRIAHNKDDDGRPFPPIEWTRETVQLFDTEVWAIA